MSLRDGYWLLALAVSLLIAIAIAPIGFIGGGWDDWRYLNAARCWREFGPCIPQDHWQGRWPIVAPLAMFTGLFSESRVTVAIGPLVASIACLLLLAKLGNGLLGRPIGWIAALLLLVTPSFTLQLLTPRVEPMELAFILGGALAVIRWRDERNPLWALLAGVLLAMAIQVRETAAIATAFAALYVAVQSPRASLRDLMYATIGLATPFAAEFIIYAVSTGDPFWRIRLAIGHTQILSNELLVSADPDHAPFFNKTYIANWRRDPGVYVHWSIDGLVNLFINVKAGFSLALTPLVLLVGRPYLAARDQRIAVRLWLAALAYISVLIYVLAVDPKSRMMLVPLCATHLAFALLTWRLKQAGRIAVVVALWGVWASIALLFMFGHQSIQSVEGYADKWIAALPGQIEIDPNTRRHLTLLRPARDLPGLESNSAYLLYNSPGSCTGWLRHGELPTDSFYVAAKAASSRMAFIGRGWSGYLCLLRYNRPLPPNAVREAILRSRRDGSYILLQRRTFGARD